jgi:ketosteroid isomerase-like protein
MPSSTEEALIQLLETQLDAFADLDVDRLLATFAAEGAVLQDMADPENPFEGLEEIRGFLQGYFGDIEDASVDIISMATNADTVVAELEMKFTWVAVPFSPEDGRDVLLRYVVFDTVRDGKIIRERFYWNPAELDGQLSR